MWVAIVAAVASIVGALVAARSASAAREGAHSIASLNHRVAALDDQIARFREDHLRVMEYLPPHDVREVGRCLSALDVLRAGTLATEALAAATEAIGEQLALALQRQTTPRIDDDMKVLREEVRSILTEAETRRQEMLEGGPGGQAR